MDLSLSYLLLASTNGRLLLLKSDLWDEGVSSASGHIYDLLRERKKTTEIVGIDVSPVICNFAKMRMCNEEPMVACADVRKLPFGSETFDVILDASTLDHIPPTDIPSVMNEYERILKEGGILTISFDSITFWLCLRKIYNKLLCREIKTFKFWWRLPPNWIKDKLGECGFTILSEFPLGIFSLSLFFLKTSQSNLVRRVVPKLLRHSLRSMKFTKASRYLFPFSRQYFFIAWKQRPCREDSGSEI